MKKVLKIEASEKIIYSIICILVTFSQILMIDYVEKIINGITDKAIFSTILNNGLWALVFISLYQLVSVIKNYIGTKIVRDKIIIIKEMLFSKYFSNSNPNKPEYISIFCNDVSLIESNYYMAILNLFECGLTFVLVSIAILLINKWIYLSILFLILFNFLFNIISQSSMNRNMNRISRLFNIELSMLENFFSNYISIKNLNIDNQVKERYCLNNKSLEYNRYKYTFRSNSLLSFYNGLGFINIIIITLISSFFIIRGQISLGNLLGITILSNILFGELPPLMVSFLNIKSSSDILFKILEKISIENKEKITFNKLFNIKLNNVSVKYNDNIILNNIKLDIFKGSKVVLKGGNGSGKSTLLLCLLNLVDYEGEIWFNNINIKNKDVFGEVVYIAKDSFILDDTLEFNIFLDNEYSCSEVTELMEILGIKDLFGKRKKDEKLNISNLSSGEKQKIELFRLLLKKPKCIIIDEGLSMVEDSTRKNIIRYLLKLNCTLFYVSHDNSDFKYFKQIINLSRN